MTTTESTTTKTPTTVPDLEDKLLDNPLERTTLRELELELVHEVEEGMETQVLGEDKLDTSWKLRTDETPEKSLVRIGDPENFGWEEGEVGEIKLAGEDVEHDEDIYSGDWTFDVVKLPPGTNDFEFALWDEEDEQIIYERVKDMQVKDYGFRVDVVDETPQQMFLKQDGMYSNDRRSFDKIHMTRTEEEWWEFYRNDWKPAEENFLRRGGVRFDELAPRVEETYTRLNNDNPSLIEEREAKARAIYQTVGKAINRSDMKSSGAASQTFYGAERYLADKVFDWSHEEYFSSWITGNWGNHEINFVAFKAPTEDDPLNWELRFHNPMNWEESWSEPETSIYRKDYPDVGSTVDGFNYEKIQKFANSRHKDGFGVEQIHYQPAESLFRLVENGANDLPEQVSGIGERVVFEESYLKSLQEATRNENFRKPVLDKLVNAGRLIYETAESEKFDINGGDDYIGIGGELGEEEVYRLNEGQKDQVIESFRYTPGKGVNEGTGWENQHPPEAVDDISKMLSAS